MSKVLPQTLFGLVKCYNGLPQTFADWVSMKAFQRNFLLGLLRLAELGAKE